MQDATRAPKDGKKRILVVDDTESVADLMREMLISFGYEAEISLIVEASLAAYAPGKYDLVITDYLMPKMNGVEFATAMKQKSPGQRVLLITGSTFPMTEINPRQLPVEATLQKPFSVEEFQQSVNDVLALPPILFNPAVMQQQPRPQFRAS
jgi:DNA-binding NtrC family response regulator